MNPIRDAQWPARSIVVPGLMAATLVTLAACGGGKGDASRVVIQVPTQAPLPAAPTKVAVNVIDAATGNPLSDVTFTVTGPNASNVVDENGTRITTSTAADGNFSADYRGTPTAGSPISVSIIASKNGYVSSSAALLTDAEGAIAETVRLVQISQPPAGVAVKSDTSATSGGMTLTEKTVSSTAAATGTGGGSITIPQSTQARRSDGTPAAGTLAIDAVFFDNQTEDSLDSFPGGFGVEVNTGTPGTGAVDEGAFVSGGFAAYEVTDDTGAPITQFDTPITLQIEVPAGTINPDTGNPVQASEEFPIWSYDEATGRWEEHTLNGVIEKGRVVSTAANGNFIVEFKTDHLSYYNVDYFFGRSRTCTATIDLRNLNQTVRVRLTRSDGTGFYKRMQASPNDPILRVARIAGQVPIKIDVETLNGNPITNGSRTEQDVCDGPSIFNLDPPPPPPPTSIRVTLTESCPDGSNRRPIQSTYSSIYQRSPYYWTRGNTDANGQVTYTDLSAGETYVYVQNRRNYRDSYYERIQLTAGESREITINRTLQCATVTGTGSTGAGDN